MKIFITSHGNYEYNHVSLCTTDFEKAVLHFLEYSKTSWYNCMSNFDIWENDEEYYSYGSKNKNIINRRENTGITFDEIRADILLSLEDGGKSL